MHEPDDAALDLRETIPDFSPPRLPRTREALRRIVGATWELLLERGPGGTSLVEVAAAAEVSTSSLYRRFRVKSALLDYAHAITCEANQRTIGRVLDEMLAARPDLPTLTLQLFRFGIANAKASGPLSHAFRRASAEVPSIATRENLAERMNQRRVEEVVLALFGEAVDDDVRTRVSDAVRVYLSLLREGGDTPGVTALFPGADDEDIARRLTTLALCSIAPRTAPLVVPARERDFPREGNLPSTPA